MRCSPVVLFVLSVAVGLASCDEATTSTDAPNAVGSTSPSKPDDAKPPASWRPVMVTSSRASSVLREGKKKTRTHPAAHLHDGDLKTAWVEGAKGPGKGEWVEWTFAAVPAVEALRFRVHNGYQKTKSLHKANGAPTRIKLQAFAKERTVKEQGAVLRPVWGEQELGLDLDEAAAIDRVRLTVLEVRAGSKYEDTCISEVRTEVKTSAPSPRQATAGTTIFHSRYREEAVSLEREPWGGGQCKQAKPLCRINPAEFVARMDDKTQALFAGVWTEKPGPAAVPRFAVEPAELPEALFALRSDWEPIGTLVEQDADRWEAEGDLALAGKLGAGTLARAAGVAWTAGKGGTLAKLDHEEAIGGTVYEVKQPRVTRVDGQVTRIDLSAGIEMTGHARGKTVERMLLLYDDGLLRTVLREKTGVVGAQDNGSAPPSQAYLLLEAMHVRHDKGGKVSRIDQETVIATQGKEITHRTARLVAH